MAALFLLALILITWQALRAKPALPPAYEIATKGGEQIAPVAVPSWRPPLDPPRTLTERRSYVEERSVPWPGVIKVGGKGTDCQVFVRLSSHHWARRPASRTLVQQWLGTREVAGSGTAWQLLYFPVGAFLDDDDGDGDPLDAGELRQAGPGAEVEAFCGQAPGSSGGLF